MATDGGRPHPSQGSDGSSETARADGAHREPELLPADWPSPVSWGAPLGAGGEALGGAPDLVQLGRDHGSASDEPEAGRPRTRRRTPRSGPDRSRSTPPARRRSLRAPSLGASVVTGIVAGLAGLMLFVLFSSSGWAPASPGGTVAGLSAAAPQAPLELADLAVASQQVAMRMRKAARERHQATLRHRRELARRRAREHRSTPTPVTRPVTRQVAAPAPPPPRPVSASPSVSSAERALAPGPWNLS